MNQIYLISLTLGLLFLSNTACNKQQATQEKQTPTSSLIDPATNLPANIVLDTLASGLKNPWGLDFLPDGSVLVTERTGKMKRYQNGTLSEISGMPKVRQVGQGGLMDVLLHPDYVSNKTLFFSATTAGAGGQSTALYKAQLNEKANALENLDKIYQATPINESRGHFGSRIVIDKAGYLFLSLGERQMQDLAQDRSNSSGTVLRLNQDGTIPKDNPFYGQTDMVPEIWTYGHRNPQGMAIHPKTNAIWVHEHGPRGGDEINVLEKGANYGWPLATYGINYDGSTITNDTIVEGTLSPIHYWVPSIAPCGMSFYTGDKIPQWKGSLFVTALVGMHLNRLEFEGTQLKKEERMLQGFGRFRAVKQGRDGNLYFVTEENGGLLCRLRPQ